jgi:hypothetical protein
LALQDLAGRGEHRGVVVVEPAEVGQHHGGSGVPGHATQRGEVGRHREVAVAACPGGHLVPVDRVHLHVDGKQVVAALRAVLHHLVEEVPGMEPLALQASLHVGDGDDHGVDLTAVDERRQLVERQHVASTV